MRIRHLVAGFLIGFLGAGIPLASFAAQNGQHVKPWKTQTIKVYVDSPSWQPVIDSATDRWNRTKIAPPFVQVRSPEHADVTVSLASPTMMHQRCPKNPHRCLAYSSIGMRKHAFVVLPSQLDFVHHDIIYYLRMAVHEFGHVLGLRDTADKCSAMNGFIENDVCLQSLVVAGPFPADVAKLRALYQ